MSVPTFLELGVSESVVDSLGRKGIVEPFEIQSIVLPDALAGRDVLGKSRTGSGKTLAFAIPIVERTPPDSSRPFALVLVPTRELAQQVTDEIHDIAKARGLRTAAAFGGVSLPEQAKKAAKSHILIATPGRLEDLVTRKLVDLSGVGIFVLDEADRMLDMGFYPQVAKIERRISRERRQTMFFSATLDGTVGHMAKSYTRDAVLHEVVALVEHVESADHRFVQVDAASKVETLVKLLQEDRGLALVFVRTKRGADRLVEKLKRQGVRAAALHGDMTQAARDRALERFEDGKVDTLVATDVAARGLDLEHITHVVNFDPPEDAKGYLHRVGRTARAGRGGTGVTLVQPDQAGDVSRMASRLKLADEFEDSGMKVAPPRVVYSSRGKGARIGARGRRR
jgi:superfamily II DNA/RNA helicase